MLREIVTNLTRRKKAISIPREFMMTPEGVEESEAIRESLDRIFGRSLRIRQVDAGSCNACEWECTALTNPLYDIQRFGIDFVASPRHADMLLVTGPVSRQMQLALRKTYLATPEPRIVVACGDCAMDGGVYKGSYAVTSGVARVVPVDCSIPGCPPSPLRILAGLVGFIDRLARAEKSR